MKQKRYYYRDMATNRRRFTIGKFVGWVPVTLFGVEHWYAHFQNPSSSLFIPPWCLLLETKANLPEAPKYPPRKNQEAAGYL